MNIYNQYADQVGQILEAANVGLWDWNMEDDSVQFDPVWAALIGYDIAEVDFDLAFWSDRVHPDDLQSCYDDIQLHLSGEVPLYENVHRMQHKDGHWVYILDRGKVTSHKNGKPSRFMGTHVDVSELVNSRQTIDRLTDRAIDNSQSQSMFIANMSHELRSPLNAILGFSELTLKDETLTDSQQENIRFVFESAKRLLALTNDILDFSKIQAGKLQIYNDLCQFQEVIENLKKTHQINADEKGVNLFTYVSAEIPETLITDALRLNQILINLVGNAIKFTPRQGWVCVSVDVLERQAQSLKLIFSVIDSGIGIAAEQRQSIFQDYSQAEASTTHKYGGTGLGLSISSKLIALMGGEIWLVSEPNIGSGFYFTIEVEIDKA